MKRQIIAFVLLALLFVWILWSVLIIQGVKRPGFELITKSGNLSIIKTNPIIKAQVVVNNKKISGAMGQGFSSLAGYIFGGNTINSSTSSKVDNQGSSLESGSKSIPMTSPVQAEQQGSQTVVSFIMPEDETLQTLPDPNNKNVTLKQIPQQYRAVWKFSGLATENRVEKQKVLFENALKEQGIKPLGVYTLSQYNPPTTFPLMRENDRSVEIEYSTIADKTSQPSLGSTKIIEKPDDEITNGTMVATFAAGCFWCSEAGFQEEPGVLDVISGFAGGKEFRPTYEDVVAKKTSHREAVQVTYDPKLISYERLLVILWRTIDPTDDGGQFVDRGFSYTTAIFYHADEQLKLAQEAVETLDKSGKYEKPIVTKILPFTTFYPAEEYHQDFYKKSSTRYNSYKNNSGRKEYLESLDK